MVVAGAAHGAEPTAARAPTGAARARVPRLPGRRRTRSRSGDQLHAAQGCPREDQGGRRRDRRGPHPQGPAAPPRAARGWRRPTAASSPRCCPRSASPAAPTRSPRCPTGGTIRSPLLILVGMGEAGARRPGRRTSRRRAAALRACPTPRRVALALPAARRAPGPRGRRGQHARRLHLHRLQVRPPTRTGPGEVVVLTDTARTKAAQQRRRGRPVVAEATALARDWVNTPPGDLTPEIVRRRRRRRAQGAQAGQGEGRR